MKIKTFILTLLVALPMSGSAIANDDAFHDYHNGQYLKVVDQLKQLASNKDKIALFYYGKLYIYGYGRVKDTAKGLEYITKSAELSYLPAQVFLGKYYLQKENDPEKALYWFKKAADKSNPEAQMFAAAAYLHGFGVKKNLDIAKRYVIMAARSGNAAAQYTLAQNFLQSKHKKNKMLGLLWLKKAAKQNYVMAQAELGKLYFLGIGVEEDLPKAYFWLIKAADQSPEAQYYIGRYYQNIKAPDSGAKALEWFNKAATNDFPAAQVELGMLYLNQADMKDEKKGYLLILKAAQHNNKQAQIQLSKMYQEGVVVDKNEELAKQWLDKAQAKEKKVNIGAMSAKERALLWINNGKKSTSFGQGYELRGILSDWNNKDKLKSGLYNLSPVLLSITRTAIFNDKYQLTKPNEISIMHFMHVIGALRYQKKQPYLFIPRYSLPKVVDKAALAEIQHLADHGYAQAQFKLAEMHQHGISVKSDITQAINWYTKSASQHYMKAEYALGLLYLEGKGVAKDYKLAVEWLEKAAFRGNAYAQYLLGLVYEFGLGDKDSKNYIEKNVEYARGMYNLAANKGYAKAKFNLAELYISGVFGPKKTVALQRQYDKLILSLYESAAEQNIPEAKLALAFYYAESLNKDKQKWAFSVVRKAAQKGDQFAGLLLAMMYDRGLGTSENKSSAIYWYKEAVKHNNPIAQFVLGTHYYLGDDVRANKEKAILLLSLAAKHHIPYAYYNLAVIKHAEGDTQEFLPLLQKASQQHYSKASILLADYYLQQASDNKQLKDAAYIYQKLADQGYPKAQLKLGFMYEHGLFFKRNYESAAQWYQKAAEQDNHIAQFFLANMYQVGKLGSIDFAKAEYWYQQAAKLGFVPATVALGFIYENIKHDYQQALKYYQQAAEKGVPQAQFDLALMYEYGKGIKVNFDQAYDWYKKAAKKGFALAQYALGNLYLRGQGVSDDSEDALEWYQKAAQQNNVYALYQLGLMYESGVGTKINLEKALYYYKEAAKRGNEKAKLALARLYENGPDQIKKPKEAFKLYNKMAARGNVFAKYKLAQMYQYGIEVAKNIDHAKMLYKNVSAKGDFLAMLQLNAINAAANKEVNNVTIYNHLEPIIFKVIDFDSKRSENMMYMHAINQLNQGYMQNSLAELLSLMKHYPDFMPAKKTYEAIFYQPQSQNLSMNKE